MEGVSRVSVAKGYGGSLRFRLTCCAILYLPGESYDAWPTEGGHAELAPRDDLEYGFIKVRGTGRGSRSRYLRDTTFKGGGTQAAY